MVIGTQAANADTQVDSNHVRVEQGDTISGIAQKHNVSVDSLVQANHMSNPDMIFVGDTLVLTPNADNNNNQSANVQNNVQPATQTPSDGDSQHMNQPVHMIENNENTANNNQPATNTQQATPVTNTTVQQSAPVTNTTTVQQSTPVATPTQSSTLDDNAAANAIGAAESGNSYSAMNGRYVGRWQLDASYLNGDYSPANQDRVFQQYCNQRYGGINQALAFRQSHGWY